MERPTLRSCVAGFIFLAFACTLMIMTNQNAALETVIKTEQPMKTKTKAGNKPPKYPPLIFYTRAPKCGGRSLLSVIKALSKRNDFYVNGHGINGRRPPLRSLIKDARFIADMRTPGIYSPHMHFVNFQKYGLQQPVMINLIRDPAEQFASLYYFAAYGDSTAKHNRTPNHKITDINKCIKTGGSRCVSKRSFLTGSFFCGQGSQKCTFGSDESVQIAKRHIDENYLFVGITEEFDNTLKILEKILPDYFKGATKIWEGMKENMTQSTATKSRGKLTPTSRLYLQKTLSYEYKIYNHVKRKFYRLKEQLRIK